MTDQHTKLTEEITRFFEVYNILSPEGKAGFEAQLGPKLNSSDKKTRIFYEILLSAAKDNATAEEAIDRLNASV